MLARDRGLTVSEMRSTVSQDYVSSISLRAETDGDPVSVSGSVLGRDHGRVTQVNGFEIEVTPAGHMVFFTYVDRPGIIGKVGTLLGQAAINIATMDVGRKAEGGEALMCLTVDTEAPPEVLDLVATEIEAHQLRTVTLPPA
jgi:D-3-phosphoglycerate dehydrogenase